MRNWLPWILGAVAVILVVYAFSKYANDRLPPERNGPGPDEDAEASALVGKPAPNLEGDFAVNGKPIKLSDLKGNVVLVDFWAVWCNPCIRTFPHLREWQQRYHKEGLEIVGVTEPTEPTKLKEFAVKHQLAHLLMTMTPSNFDKAWRDYNVNGIPHVALIDRGGIVRMVKVGAQEQNAVALESEIKKLLAQ